MKVLLAQMPVIEVNLDLNLNNMLLIIRKSDADLDLIVFPETTLSGFPEKTEMSSVALTTDSKPIRLIRDAARTKGVAVAFGFSEQDGNDAFNTALLVDKTGKIALKYRKTHLWPHTDAEVFKPGAQYGVCELNGMRVGMLICYDIEFPETSRSLALLGVDLILVLDGNMDPFGPVHRRAVTTRAMENQCFVVLVNRIGEGRGLVFSGESVVVDPFGEVVEQAEGHHPVTAVLDFSLIAQSREHYSYLDDRRASPGQPKEELSENGIANLISCIADA